MVSSNGAYCGVSSVSLGHSTLNGEISRETPASPDAKADQQFYVLNELGKNN